MQPPIINFKCQFLLPGQGRCMGIGTTWRRPGHNICTKFKQILFVMMNSSCPIETAMNCFLIHFQLFHLQIRFAINGDQKAPPSLEAKCPSVLQVDNLLSVARTS